VRGERLFSPDRGYAVNAHLEQSGSVCHAGF
jgi:hypothetical protein